MADLPTTVEIHGTTYTLRPYTPKRKGETAGHGWLREVGNDGFGRRSEVAGPVALMIDEIVALRALCDGRAEEQCPDCTMGVPNGRQ